MKHWIASVLKQKCARVHQILFNFHFPRTLATGGFAPIPRKGGRGREGREGKGTGREGDGMGEVCVIAVDVLDAPGMI